MPFEDDIDRPFDWRRLASAVLRHKWLLVAATTVGFVGAGFAWANVEPRYSSEGNLWIQVENRSSNVGDVSPIRQSGLLANNAWVELVRSFAVLDPVVVEQRLYLTYPNEAEAAFASFGLAEQFIPGRFDLALEEDEYLLTTSEGIVVERGTIGSAVGENIGFVWTPAAATLPRNTELEFTVLPPRDAAKSLADRLETRIDRDGNFIALSLEGADPDKITSILNAVMDRLVQVADELKRGRIEETLEILEEQLVYSEDELANAERSLEEFRITTIALPSDQSTAITPGLEITRDPVFGSYFQMRVDLEELRRDQRRLQAVVDAMPTQGVRIETLELIPAAGNSTELRAVLAELVTARSELRALEDRYSPEYPPIQDLMTRISTLEQQTVPRIVGGINAELGVREQQLTGLVASASGELAAIPPRTIEEGRLRRRFDIQENIYNDLRQRVETARLAAASSIPDVRTSGSTFSGAFPESREVEESDPRTTRLRYSRRSESSA
jgi:uncharacterized protein involved in exopolysaccharide biosynthesis